MSAQSGSETETPQCSRSLHHVVNNPFLQGSGPCHDLEYNQTAYDFFTLLFEEEFFDTIVTETNRYAEAKQHTGGALIHASLQQLWKK